MPKTNTKIDSALCDGLQQAKKKPRYYCLIAKGADVVGMMVQKKPLLDGPMQKAKTELKGNLIIQGVCHGEGQELTLEVLEAEPNIKLIKIKDFVSEQTELTIKPKWAVVPKHTAVVDEEAGPVLTANQPADAAVPNQGGATPAEAPSLQERLRSLLIRHKALTERIPALRDKLLPFAQAASVAVSKGSADAPAALDKMEQALNISEGGTQQPPPRPSQGPGASSAAPQRPAQAPPGSQSQPPQRPGQGPPTGSQAAPPRPGQAPPGNQQPAGRRAARPSLFERAKNRIKSLGRDTEKQAAFEEIRCSSALDSVGYAIDKVAQDNPNGGGPQVAEFSHEQMDLQVKLQQLWNSPQVDPQAIGNVRKAAEVLEHKVVKYVDESTACQQALNDFSKKLKDSQEEFQNQRDRNKGNDERLKLLETYAPLLDAAQKDYDMAKREFDTTGELGPVARKSLTAHDKSFTAVAKFLFFPMRAELQARTLAMVERADKDHKSDAHRIMNGDLSGLSSAADGLFLRQQDAGIDFRKLAAPGKTLTDEEIVGLYLYTTNEFEHINGSLLFPDKYQDDPERLKKLTNENEFCQRGLSKLPEYPSICYPVIRFEDGNYDWENIYVEGTTFRNKQFWSTGSMTGAWIRNPTKACLLFRIYGKTGKDIAVLSDKQGEGYKESAVPQLAVIGKGEVLFAPGTPFKVVAVAKAEKQLYDLPTFNITLMEE